MSFAPRSLLGNSQASLSSQIERFEAETGFRIKDDAIPDDMTFRQWCERLGSEGMKVDDHPFTLENRQALHFVYDLIPTTPEQAYKKMIVLMKGAQMGLTIWEMLADIYMALKWAPCKIGMYVPDRSLAGYKSAERFMPVVRTVPAAYDRLTESDPNTGRKKGEGNVLNRTMGDSRFLFLWTSGKVATESFPLDVVSFDEVQEMLIGDMEKTMERMSASFIRFTLMLSTAKWPDADIHFWYKMGKQYRFHTECDCEDGVLLDDHFPHCVVFNEKQYRGAPKDEYVYVCPVCNAYIPDQQVGRWVAHNPGAPIDSVHLPQILSPTVSPQEIIEAYNNASDMQNFYNRKLGKPYSDPSQIPINMEILNECAKQGVAAGLKWKLKARGTYMGIDQMGAFNVAIIKERMPDGRQATIHVESIYDSDPFVRCDELMKDYGVAVCVVETLPNYNDAKRFSGRHRGRVFLAGYKDIADDMLQWGDATVSKADRKTDIESRDRYTVMLDQYKCMQTSMARMVKHECLFPDPKGLRQDIVNKGVKKRVFLLKDEVFLHFTKTALVTEKDPEQKKFRRKVVKVGIDPHYSYANMLCDVAWARSHGTSSFIIPQSPEAIMAENIKKTAEQGMPGLPENVVDMIQLPEGDVCGRCEGYDHDKGHYCKERKFNVRPVDPACFVFVRDPYIE